MASAAQAEADDVAGRSRGVGRRRRSIIPGFGLTLGFSITYLSLIVLIPLSAIAFKTATLGWADFVAVAFTDRALAAYRLSFGAAFAAAAVNGLFGLIIAWILVRYDFPGKKLVNAM
ncbi:MAG: sulfate ABC transporter permease subunit CysT, partial [Novosphingobium sp.]|nr:sulfate ABC transporter permease subunit CysT [Novosphingobium sp.]